MNAIIPCKSIRKKENNKRKIERNKNPNQRKQLNMLLADNSDTSSDYNPNFIDFPNNENPFFDIKKIRYFNEKQITEKANLIKRTDISLSKKKFIVLNEMDINSESGHNRIYYDSDSDYDDASTYYSSISLLDKSDEKRKYWIRYKLYDNIIDYINKTN